MATRKVAKNSRRTIKRGKRTVKNNGGMKSVRNMMSNAVEILSRRPHYATIVPDEPPIEIPKIYFDKNKTFTHTVTSETRRKLKEAAAKKEAAKKAAAEKAAAKKEAAEKAAAKKEATKKEATRETNTMRAIKSFTFAKPGELTEAEKKEQAKKKKHEQETHALEQISNAEKKNIDTVAKYKIVSNIVSSQR